MAVIADDVSSQERGFSVHFYSYASRTRFCCRDSGASGNMKNGVITFLAVCGISCVNPCWSLSAFSFIAQAPWLWKSFEQVLIVADKVEIHRVENWEHILDLAPKLAITPSQSHPFALKMSETSPLNAIVISIRSPESFKVYTKDWIAEGQLAHAYNFFLCPNRSVSIESLALELSSIIPLYSNVFWVCEDSYGEMTAWEVYMIKGKRFISEVDLGINDDAVWNLMKDKWKRRRNFQQVRIVATAADDQAYPDEVTFAADSTGRKFLFSGMQVEIYRILRDYLNFTEASIVGDYIVEASSNDSSVEPMHRQLEDGTADISITQSSVGEFKATVTQMVHPVPTSWLEAHFLAQNDNYLSRQFFRRPFSDTLWLVIAAYFIGVALLTKFSCKFLTCDTREDSSADIMWILSAICVRGCPWWSRWTYMRVVFLVSSSTGYLLYAAYSGALTSQLSVRLPDKVSLEDLLNRKYKFFIEYEVDFPIDLRDFPIWQDTRVTTIAQWEEFVQIVSQTAAQNLAFVTYPEFFHFCMHKSNYSNAAVCEQYTSVRVSRTPNLCSMLLNKTSELKEIFNIVSLMVMERGIYARLFKRYKRDRIPVCQKSNNSHVRQSPWDLSFALVVLLSGAFLSICALAVEVAKDFAIRKSSSLYRKSSSGGREPKRIVMTRP